MHKILSVPAHMMFLTAAIVVYALFGSPTPDNPGVTEMVVGSLLVLSIVTAGFSGGVSFSIGRNSFLILMQIFFLCGLIFPTLSGVYFGNDWMLMIRDIVAFSFLGLPLFLSEKISAHDGSSEILRGVLVFTGIAFAVRTLLPAFNIWIPQGELLYLSNSPLALFAAVYVASRFFLSLQVLSYPNFIKSVLWLGALCVLLSAMLLDVQRATIGAVGISVLAIALFTFIKTPGKVFVPVLIIAGLCLLAYPLISETLNVMAQKTAVVGMNMRVQEAMAVYDYLSLAPETFFMGRGWGAVFASPAVGGVEVNYTHSLLTMMALKGGLVMLSLSVLVVCAALYKIILIFQRDNVMGLSLFWPLLVPVLLYASHKSLDFGLLLLLIGVWSVRREALHVPPSSVKNHSIR